MKKQILTIAGIALFATAMVFTGCKKDDTTAPVITLNGSKTDAVTYKSATSYADPGATATDDQDGTIEVVVTGTVDMNSAGDYTLTYTATDAAGNSSTETRTVTVDAAPYIAGTYSHVDTIDGTAYPAEIEILTVSSLTKNKIYFAKFAGYTNAAPYATISGSSFTIPSQTFLAGNPALSTTFVTTSAAMFSATGFTVNYTITDTNGTSTGSSVYTKQ
jgi:hypothetical protein